MLDSLQLLKCVVLHWIVDLANLLHSTILERFRASLGTVTLLLESILRKSIKSPIVDVVPKVNHQSLIDRIRIPYWE